MKKKWVMTLAGIILLEGLSIPLKAQGVGDNIKSLQSVLDTLYDTMMPLCEKLTGIGRGIASFAALFYIGSRVWKHILNAEPVDFYPLFRPFVLGFCIAFFPLIMGLINGLLKPTVTGTAAIVQDSNKSIEILLKMKAEAIKTTEPWKMYVGQNKEGDKEKWLKYTHGLPDSAPPVDEDIFESFGSDISFAMSKAMYKFRNSVKEWMSEILNVLFQAAALCINTLSTFQRVVLSILGPLVFGLAVFDGMQHTLTAWLAKYINVYLWLPVCNIFGAVIAKIQEEMLKMDLSQIGNTGDTFFSATDTGYLIFMIIGIVGYFTVPSVAGFIVNAGGGGAMTSKITSLASAGAGGAVGMGKMVASQAGQGMDNLANAKSHFNEGFSGANGGSGAMGAIGRAAGNTSYMAEQLSGMVDKK